MIRWNFAAEEAGEEAARRNRKSSRRFNRERIWKVKNSAKANPCVHWTHLEKRGKCVLEASSEWKPPSYQIRVSLIKRYRSGHRMPNWLTKALLGKMVHTFRIRRGAGLCRISILFRSLSFFFVFVQFAAWLGAKWVKLVAKFIRNFADRKQANLLLENCGRSSP